MNYLHEIKSFNDWLIINPSVTSDDIVLWYALMNLNNLSGWQTEFTAAISTIMDRTRLSRSAIYRSRNRLVQMNRIRARERSGNQSSIYEILSFASQRDTLNGTHNGTQSHDPPFVSPNGTHPGTQAGTQVGTQAGTINKTKLDETKQEVSPAGPAPPKKKGVAHWQVLIKIWFDFNLEKFGDEPSFTSRDGGDLKKILQRLEKRATGKNEEWTEHTARRWFKKFLGDCFADDWLCAHFLLSNLNNQFDKIELKQNRLKNGTAHKPGPNGHNSRNGASSFLKRGAELFGAGGTENR